MTVHFIGAGPGAPDLITLRGRDLLVSSEGARSSVLRVALPASARQADLWSPAWTALRWLALARALPVFAG